MVRGCEDNSSSVYEWLIQVRTVTAGTTAVRWKWDVVVFGVWGSMFENSKIRVKLRSECVPGLANHLARDQHRLEGIQSSSKIHFWTLTIHNLLRLLRIWSLAYWFGNHDSTVWLQKVCMKLARVIPSAQGCDLRNKSSGVPWQRTYLTLHFLPHERRRMRIARKVQLAAAPPAATLTRYITHMSFQPYTVPRYVFTNQNTCKYCTTGGWWLQPSSCCIGTRPIYWALIYWSSPLELEHIPTTSNQADLDKYSTTISNEGAKLSSV